MTFCNMSYIFELEKMRDVFFEQEEKQEKYKEEHSNTLAQFKLNMEQGRKKLANKVTSAKRKAFIEDVVISISLVAGALYSLF